ncbi:hypothetical protein P153DRAFT_366534 [Dothidotthia symphoricarpi CBS 119687]|uniref:MARVEL domain-containing protein n=1 Tax=Dothidotthia symphoricarpi CBS 119687 TaxID=1392245 RepID=A0A6A6ADX8_9PLEO|nr:uncharacterized protein P153DRAFT_366534 [Dothidotthia symphoricarpi CBS 119687]KAF2130059.1 hypothetical protein P153DRAFT_366534 [Dothidotthia symphoricarpi CBS 119687]
MAASSYHNSHSTIAREQNQHLLSPALSSPGFSSGQSTPLKPYHPALPNNPHYQHEPTFADFHNTHVAKKEDDRLKANIRRLRMVSRTLAFLISVAVLVPISMTLIKFLRTQNVYRTVTTAPGSTITRTAWAKDTKAWPTYMYFAVALVSAVLNFVTIFSYKTGVGKANTASLVASGFNWGVMIGNLAVWCVAATLYRTEKDKGGKHNDLWGWTCSAPARAIQREFANEVDFNRYCSVQGVSFHIGVVQAVASLLTVVTYVFVLFRKRSKKNLQRLSVIAPVSC